MIRKTMALCLCVLGLGAPVALAQSPSKAGYGETPNVPEQRGVANYIDSSNAANKTVNADAGRLPFTGMDVGITALLAGALLGAGFGLRRVTTSRSTP